ncbi:MAG: hypothetical protein NWR72_06735 [Bacteroidia bacterium]|nr:hypothetical protein [Bacteroidia bacterium]
MLEQLDLYINAQKTIANYMLGFGLLMILLAVVLHFAGTHSLFYGMKIGLLLLGLFSAMSGYGYRKTEEKLLQNQTRLYREDPSRFHQIEKERMEKVVKNFPKIRLAFVAVIISLLIVIVVNKNSFVNGLLFSVIILLMGNTIIETVSKPSIDRYYEQLSDF